jgi:uncharacterized protein
MDLKGETIIRAPRDRVWAALNDPAVLAACIDGVERLDRIGDNRFEGVMNAKVGPVRAKFTGGVELTEIDAPNRYVIVGEGKGGVAGFAKGQAEVRLADGNAADGPETLLSYHVSSSVGGKLAQLGARLIEGTAKAYAESFFAAFKARVEVADVIAASRTEPSPAPAADEPAGLSPMIWGGAVVAAVAIFIAWLLL